MRQHKIAQLVDHLHLNPEVLGSHPVLVFFPCSFPCGLFLDKVASLYGDPSAAASQVVS